MRMLFLFYYTDIRLFCKSSLLLNLILPYFSLGSLLHLKSILIGTHVKSKDLLSTLSSRLASEKFIFSILFTKQTKVGCSHAICVMYLILQILFLGNLAGDCAWALRTTVLSE